MGRPRKYQTDAERAAAYRKRQARRVERERLAQDELLKKLLRLQKAIAGAARAGDYTAESCRAEKVVTMVDLLAAHFEALEGWTRRHPDEVAVDTDQAERIREERRAQVEAWGVWKWGRSGEAEEGE